MDFLKAEIASASKRKADADAVSPTDGPSEQAKKYLRRGELERIREEEYRKEQEQKLLARKRKEEEKRAKREKRSKSKSATPDPTVTVGESAGVAVAASAVDAAKREVFNISNEEAIRRLRQKGQPVRLFAETDKERRLRLRALELIEERGERVGQNDFMRALQGAESGMALEDLQRRGGADKEKQKEGAEDKDGKAQDGEVKGGSDAQEAKGKEGIGMNTVLDLDLLKKDQNKLYPIIYYTLKGLLQDWERSMSDRPDEIKRSTQGKLAAATQVQSAEYMKPLFKSLRKRALAPDVLARLTEIVHYVQKREYRHANDAYLRLSIGNAPWPIGVTMVGIHERSGREKIFSSNVAHVLNDEVSRKYIQSLKRLMTFAQTKYPPSDVSMLMG